MQNRKVTYAAEIGRKRRQFCIDYTAYKKAALIQGENLLTERVAAQGESISCRKGCAHCCFAYVFTTLQEAECITYYLSEHEAALQHFATSYQDWRKCLGLFEHKLPRLDQLLAGNMTGRLSVEEQEQLRSYADGYAKCRAPCPFLIDNTCSIYEVRPFVCADVVATTPPEMCRWDSSGSHLPKFYRLESDLEQEMPYFIKTRSPVVFGCMPEMIHDLLENRYAFLAGIEGLEELGYLAQRIPNEPGAETPASLSTGNNQRR